MIRQVLTLSSAAFLVLWGCAYDKSMEGTKAAREFATQKEGVCCFVGYRPLPDDERPKVDLEKAELARQLEEAKEKAKKMEARVISLEEQLKITNDLVMVKSEEIARLEGQLDAAKETAKAAPVPVAKAAPAAKEGERVTAAELAKTLSETGAVALRNILFDTGKATIKPGSEKQLAEVGQLLKNDQALNLEIQGHTDNVGKKAFNQKLSQARAAAVKDYIVKKYGIAADRLTAAGLGFDKPVADNATPQGRALNRRVELVKK